MDPHPGVHPQTAPPRHPLARALPFAAVSAAAVLLALAACKGDGEKAGAVAAAVAGDSVYPASWREPDSVKSVNGVLDVTMAVVSATMHVPLDSAGTQTMQAYQLLSANGQAVNKAPSYPGPTFIIAPGDLVKVKLYNRLSTSDNGSCMAYNASSAHNDTMPECFHGPTWTNIHYHGFHVTPDGTGDNVLLQIAPGDSVQYSFNVPKNQSPGTHWYHPHKHGSVALQVSNAMSGAFIVRDTTTGLDSLTQADNIREVLAAVQQVDSMMNLVDSGLAPHTTVNGLGAAEIPLRPNEVIRLRLVNENVSNTAQFAVFFSGDTATLPSFYDIARDGVQYDPANYDPGQPDTQLFVYPGNRLDMFVQAPSDSTGTFELQARALPSLRRSRKITDNQAQANALNRPVRLVRFRLQAARANERYATQLPADLPALPAFLSNVGATTDTAVVVFLDTGYASRNLPKGQAAPTSHPPQYYIGTAANPYQRFNDSVVYIPQTAAGKQVPMVLGDSQTWMIQNKGVAANHPFHIHVNPFQIMNVVYSSTDQFAAYYAFLNAAAAAGHPVWSDVVPLPVAVIDTTTHDTTYGQVTIRQRYEDFTGQYVMHCHILGHEERGMMQLLQVFATASAAQAYLQEHPSSTSTLAMAPAPAHGPAAHPGAGTGGGRGSGGGRGGGGGGGHGDGGGVAHPSAGLGQGGGLQRRR